MAIAACTSGASRRDIARDDETVGGTVTLTLAVEGMT